MKWFNDNVPDPQGSHLRTQKATPTTVNPRLNYRTFTYYKTRHLDSAYPNEAAKRGLGRDCSLNWSKGQQDHVRGSSSVCVQCSFLSFNAQSNVGCSSIVSVMEKELCGEICVGTHFRDWFDKVMMTATWCWQQGHVASNIRPMPYAVL